MKKIIGLMVLVACFASFSPTMAGEDAVAKPQVQFTIGHMFNVTEDLNAFAYGIFMYDLVNDYPIGFAYAGPVFTVGEANIYLMGVVMAEKIGTSGGVSGWLEYGDLFVEFDHYEAWMAPSHEEGSAPPAASYYGLVDLGHKFKNDVTVGAAYEVVGYYEDDHPFQMAYGPYIKFNKFKVWMAYDETPLVPGDPYWIFRLQFGI
jgi:hypothetical protein